MTTRLYVIRAGDTLRRLAFAWGVDADELWNHPSNRALRESHPDPELLRPGDRIHVSDSLLQRRSSYGARTLNEYRVRTTLQRVHVVLRDEMHAPLANEPWLAVGDHGSFHGTTASDGVVTFEADVRERAIVLRLTRRHTEHVVRIGGLDPVDTDEGVQQRLRNLGMHGWWHYDEAPDAAAHAGALSGFQRSQRVQASGEADATTRETLVRINGS
jgi:hypothetical protein